MHQSTWRKRIGRFLSSQRTVMMTVTKGGVLERRHVYQEALEFDYIKGHVYGVVFIFLVFWSTHFLLFFKEIIFLKWKSLMRNLLKKNQYFAFLGFALLTKFPRTDHSGDGELYVEYGSHDDSEHEGGNLLKIYFFVNGGPPISRGILP